MGLREAREALHEARHYGEWLEVAHHIDSLTGAAAWRADPTSAAFDVTALREAVLTFERLQARGDAEALATALTASLSRHELEIADPALYDVALGGTKHVVEQYLEACERAMEWLAGPEPSIPVPQRRQRFKVAAHVFGSTALMLSGGATLGFHHLGVVKALFEHQLLPRVISGSSTGAMIAAGIAGRTDAELTEMFGNPDSIRLDGLKGAGFKRFVKTGAWLAPEQLAAVLRHNAGEWTFAEAYARTSRAVNISVSASRMRQKPRLLSYITSPDVVVSSAALASSALPGLFPPAELQVRRGSTIEPAADGERWMDGSLDGDLPKLRLARLFNTNHFIVSQTNPHVLPFLNDRSVLGLMSRSARVPSAYASDMMRRATRRGPLGVAAQQAHNLVAQDYTGNIDLHPRFRWDLYKKVVSNPTRGDLDAFILEGERSVWPQLQRIRNETRISRAFERALSELEAR